MKDYVWVIIAVLAVLLLIATCIGVCVFLWKMYRYRPRRVVQVSPTAAKPIQPIQTVESQYHNYSNYLNNIDTSNSNTSVMRGRSEFSPRRFSVLQPEYYVQKENYRDINTQNWAARSIQSTSTDNEDAPKISNLRQKRQSKEFVDRDPPTEESRSDFLDPIDFEGIQEIYADSQVSYERRRPLTNVECTYQEDHSYFHNNNDRLI